MSIPPNNGRRTMLPQTTTHLDWRSTMDINPTSGQVTIAQSGQVFAAINPNFERWRTDVPGPNTSSGMMKAYSVIKEGDFTAIFSSIGRDWRLHLPTQGQIVMLCQEFPEFLPSNTTIFFGFQVHGENDLFVAGVRKEKGALLVAPYRMNDPHVWPIRHPRRVAFFQ